MKIVRKHKFGNVDAYELGYSPFGRPMMTVCCYIAGGVLIDTGQSHMEKAVIDIARSHKLSSVLLTHHHEDHSGNAAVLKQIFHLPVMAHPLTVAKMQYPYKIFPYQHWMWGATTPVQIEDLPSGGFETGNLKFQPVHAPGHSKDHTVFLEINNGWLFSGDLYLGDRIKYFRADEKIADQIESIKKVLSYDFDALYCCHRPQPVKGKKFLSLKLQFLEDFYGNVFSFANQGMNEKLIMRRLRLKEQQLIRMMCFGNVSMRNMVRSVLMSLKN